MGDKIQTTMDTKAIDRYVGKLEELCSEMDPQTLRSKRSQMSPIDWFNELSKFNIDNYSGLLPSEVDPNLKELKYIIQVPPKNRFASDCELSEICRLMIEYPWVEVYGLNVTQTMELPYDEFRKMRDALVKSQAGKRKVKQNELMELLPKLLTAQIERADDLFKLVQTVVKLFAGKA